MNLKINIMPPILYFSLLPSILLFAQLEKTSNQNRRWLPLDKNYQQATKGLNSDENLNGNFSQLIKPKQFSVSKNYDRNIFSSTLNSAWEKLPGPNGGTVRKFYEFNNQLYCSSDREFFRLELNEWVSLGFSHILCNIINDIFITDSGRIFVATDFGLYFKDDTVMDWERVAITNNYHSANDFYKKSDDLMLITTEKGIYFSENLDADSLVFNPFALEGQLVYSLEFDSKGNLYVGTERSIWKLAAGESDWQILDVPESWFSEFIITSDDVIYTHSSYEVLKSTDYGLTWSYLQGYIYEDITLYENEYLLITTFTGLQIADDQGIIWESGRVVLPHVLLFTYVLESNEFLVGTLGGGAFKYYLDSNNFFNFNNGLSVSTIRGIIPMKNGELLVSTDSDSLYKSSDNGITWQSLKQGWSREMVESKSGAVFVAADGGIMKSSDYGETWTTLNINVGPYYIDAIDVAFGDSVIFAGTTTGELYLSFDGGMSFEKVRDSDYNWVDAVKIIDRDSYIFYTGPFYHYNHINKEFTEINHPDIGRVLYFFDELPGKILLSTFNGLFSSEDGLTWKEEYDGMFTFRDLKRLNNGVFIGLVGAGVYYSTGNLNQWEFLLPPLDNTFDHSTAITNNFIFLGTQDKGLYRASYSVSDIEIQYDFSLSQNYPNPFNSFTNINYSISNPSFVQIKIYDVLGRELETIVAKRLDKGEYNITWQPKNLSSGIYIYTLITDSYNESRKLLYLK